MPFPPTPAPWLGTHIEKWQSFPFKASKLRVLGFGVSPSPLSRKFNWRTCIAQHLFHQLRILLAQGQVPLLGPSSAPSDDLPSLPSGEVRKPSRSNPKEVDICKSRVPTQRKGSPILGPFGPMSLTKNGHTGAASSQRST